MPRFIEIASGSFINAYDIDRIDKARGKAGGSELRMRGRDGLAFSSYMSPDDLAELLGAEHVQAQPGFYLVNGDVSDDVSFEDFERWQTPIVAWRFAGLFTTPTPVTVDGAWDGVTDYGRMLIIQPNGLVASPGNQSWQSLREAYDDLRKEAT
jgi:hypothetical protein